MTNRSFFFAIIFVLCCHKVGYSQPVGTKFSDFLKQTVNSDDKFWVRVHAAEALLENNFTLNAKNVFHSALQATGPPKIGALRVAAEATEKDSIQYRALGRKILEQFRTAEEKRTQLIALEAMGKLGLYFPDHEIRQIATSGSGGIQTLAQWVLSNSGDPSALSKLVQFLFSSDSTQVRYAAYALRFKGELPPESYRRMKEKYHELKQGNPFRVYLVSALWVHAPPRENKVFKKELISYRNGKDYQRFEVFQSLAAKGSKDLLGLIQNSFKDKNKNVKVSVAQAYLANEHFLQNKVGWLDWSILVLYGIFLLGIGWFYSYQQKNKEDYFLGGGAVNPLISGISMYVSFFSAITYLAVAGEVIKYGPIFPLAVIIGAPIIYVLGSYFLIPFFMDLKMISAYEILEKPLGKEVRQVASIIFLITRVVWMALLIFLASKALVVMMGWDEQAILVISVILGTITIIYTSMGGLKAVLATDVLQFFILLLGAILTIGLIVMKYGSITSLIPHSWPVNWEPVDFFNFDPYIRLTIFFAIINNITWWICTTGADQMAIQRFLSTKDLKAARQAFGVTQVGTATMSFILMVVGYLVMKFYNSSPNLLPASTSVSANADFLFPYFISHQLPTGISGLVIAALFSAAMSSLSSGVNSTSSVLTSDILPIFNKNSFKTDLKTIRISSGLIGVVVVLLSLLIPMIPGNIIAITSKTNGLFIAPLFNLFFMALFIESAKPFGVIMGSVYGLLAAFTIGFWDVLTGNPPLSFLWIAISSLIVSVLSSLLFSLIFPYMQKKKAVIWGGMLLVLWAILFLLITK